MDSQKFWVVSHQDAFRFAFDSLTKQGVSGSDAKTTAEGLVDADLCGVDTHGIQRIPIYCQRLELGLISANPRITVDNITPVCAHIDGDDGLGFVVATKAVEVATDRARDFGFAISGIKRSTHFGMARFYIQQAVDSGFAAIVMTNASPSLPPWGSKRPIFGTSPIAIGFPNPSGENHFLLDMAPSVAARGKIRKAMRAGERIPEGWALDAEGRHTTDPLEAVKGVVLPIGGPKGSGIAMALDIFSGLITGAGFAGAVGDQLKVFDRPQNVGHFILVLNPEIFVGSDEYKTRFLEWELSVVNAPPAEGVNRVYLPGQIESENKKERLVKGIPYLEKDVRTLNEFADECGIPPLTC
jgi:LDH2 family malate/lactate/ureidoglycolate dehydrogenase